MLGMTNYMHNCIFVPIKIISHGLLYHMALFVASGISVRHDARTSRTKYFVDEFVLPINVVCQHLEVFLRILAEI